MGLGTAGLVSYGPSHGKQVPSIYRSNQLHAFCMHMYTVILFVCLYVYMHTYLQMPTPNIRSPSENPSIGPKTACYLPTPCIQYLPPKTAFPLSYDTSYVTSTKPKIPPPDPNTSSTPSSTPYPTLPYPTLPHTNPPRPNPWHPNRISL